MSIFELSKLELKKCAPNYYAGFYELLLKYETISDHDGECGNSRLKETGR